MTPSPPAPNTVPSDSAVLETVEHGDVLVLRLNRPGQRNAVSPELAEAIGAALAHLEEAPHLRVGVLSSTGTAFCAGTDLRSGTSPRTEAGGEYGLARLPRSKPLIAAVDGPAVGGGFEIVLSCDLVVAGTDAWFALPEVRRGLVANCGALFRAPDRLPRAIATEMLLTGDPLTADQAHGYGLVNHLVEPGQAEAAALDLAARITPHSPAAIAFTLDAIAAATARSEAAGWAATEAATERAAASPDASEGIAAFFERRVPQWYGQEGSR